MYLPTNFRKYISFANNSRITNKKKLSIVFTYTERLKELFFQEFTQNLFN